MTVETLIKRLEQLPPETIVVVPSSNFELNNALVPVTTMLRSSEGMCTVKSFRDAFDGEVYEKQVYALIGSNISLVTFLS